MDMKDSDVKINASAKIGKIVVKKMGKVEVKFTSNHKTIKYHESSRVNIPQELKEGDVCHDSAIRSRRENSLDENDILEKINNEINKIIK
jgi:hypothetical protein